MKTFINEPWLDNAMCANMEPAIFFPPPKANNGPAKSICYQCPVRNDCLNYALQHNIREGVWGGMGERERQREAKRRKDLMSYVVG